LSRRASPSSRTNFSAWRTPTWAVSPPRPTSEMVVKVSRVTSTTVGASPL